MTPQPPMLGSDEFGIPAGHPLYAIAFRTRREAAWVRLIHPSTTSRLAEAFPRVVKRALLGSNPWTNVAAQDNSLSCAGRLRTAGSFIRLSEQHVEWARVLASHLAILAALTLFLIALLAANGYARTSGPFFQDRVNAWRVAPVVDSKGRTIGGLPTGLGSSTGTARPNFEFLELRGVPPPIWVAAIKHMEDRGLGDEERICGIDWKSAIGRPITTALAMGGSGVLQQVTKQLLSKEGDKSDGVLIRLFSKIEQFGAACQLWYQLPEGQRVDAALRLYANVAPVAQGYGTLRGVEAASSILFGVSPRELTPARQVLLAAAVKRPLLPVKQSDLRIRCDSVWPRTSPRYDRELARAFQARQTLCRAIHRAREAIPNVLTGLDLEAALKELNRMEEKGLEAPDEWTRVPGLDVPNLSTRYAKTLPEITRREISQDIRAIVRREEVSRSGTIRIGIDVERQAQLSDQMNDAMRLIDARFRDQLCLSLPLSSREDLSFSQRANPRRHGCAEPTAYTAQILAVKANSSGAITAVFGSNALLMDTSIQLGSLSKLAVALATARAGFDPLMKVCPRRALDGGRELRRVDSLREHGFTDEECRDSGRHITLERAFSRSDNLSTLELCRLLGARRLEDALGELGWKRPDGEDLCYAVSMGTVIGTPRQVLQGVTPLFGEAYGQQTGSPRPSVVKSFDGVRVPAGDVSGGIRPLSPAGRENLRKLLEAPFHQQGTLGFMRPAQQMAGKTGTTQSAFQVTGDRSVNSKLAVTYSPRKREVSLLVVTSPSAAIPLAASRFPTITLAPLYRAALH